MTHMLAGLAGGRLVVALEVQSTSSVLRLLIVDILRRVDIISNLYLDLLWLYQGFFSDNRQMN